MNVTYLLGAGASAEALPIVKNLPSSIKRFMKQISKKEFHLPNSYSYLKIEDSLFKIQENLIKDFEWILNERKTDSTIDDFAYCLFRDGNLDKLTNLKLALTVYFICQQLQNPYDSRYQFFLESILKRSGNSFPDNVKILTWNYDFQLEKCFGTMTKNYGLHDIAKNLNVASKYANLSDFDEKRFGVVKLNGTTNIIKLDEKKEFVFIDAIEREFEENTLERILFQYANGLYNRSQYFPGISFAWEVQEGNNEIVKAAMRATCETEVLVVIGYSFPDVNVVIDREIVKNMTDLKKIYYQIPDANQKIDEIKSKLCLTDIEVCPKVKTEHFFIPI